MAIMSAADGSAFVRCQGARAQHPHPAGRRDAAPHGGFKHSGYGKDLSLSGLEDYTRIKHVMSALD